MAFDSIYTNGVIAVKEKALLGDALLHMCEGDVDTAFRTLCERSFGGGLETATDPFSYEKLVVKEEENIDAFVREYAPSGAERAFFLSAKDFHNAKALLKARYLHTDAQPMLAPEGQVSLSVLRTCIETEDYSALQDGFLRAACKEGADSLKKEVVSGAEIGEIFEKHLRAHLRKSCRGNLVLKKLLREKMDMLNIVTAFRCADVEEAESKFIDGGKFPKKMIPSLFLPDLEKIEQAFLATPWIDFIRLCLKDKGAGRPLVAAEKYMDGYETEYFHARRYELRNSQPFIYYVSRRKTESANVRIVFACLLAGFGEADVKKRLRGVL